MRFLRTGWFPDPLARVSVSYRLTIFKWVLLVLQRLATRTVDADVLDRVLAVKDDCAKLGDADSQVADATLVPHFPFDQPSVTIVTEVGSACVLPFPSLCTSCEGVRPSRSGTSARSSTFKAVALNLHVSLLLGCVVVSHDPLSGVSASYQLALVGWVRQPSWTP